MTNTEDDTFARRRAENEQRSALVKDALAFNKTALFEALAASGVNLVIVRFDGAGDSGQVEEIETRDLENRVMVLPDTPIELGEPKADLSGLEISAAPLPAAIEDIAYACLEQVHDGWEINDGAYGEFRFDVAARAITLAYHERYMSEEFSEHTF